MNTKQARCIIDFVLLLMLVSTAYAQNMEGETNILTYKKYQLSFGLGTATSFEKNIMNVTSDVGIEPGILVHLAFYQNLSETFALGCRIYGYAETLPEFWVSTQGGTPTTTKFDFTAADIGLEGRYYFRRESVQPFVFGLLNLCSGSIESSELGKLNSRCLSVGLGGGGNILLSENWLLTLELFATLGSAKWEKKPFTNSTGDELNPGLLGMFLNVSYCFGE